MNIKYPVYIISKGRYKKTLTADNFIRSGIDYFIAVEPQEYNQYVEKLGVKRVLKLPFSNLGLGSYPARNFCWEHAKSNGYKYHWLFDDNISCWKKWINGKRKSIIDLYNAFIYIENYAKKTNIDILGFEEPNFVVKTPKKPFKHNCHVYSAMLIKNNLPYRWRLKYNEDVDLCLQVLHNGGTTASCVYYMADKISTAAKMKGGNQTELYQGNKAEKNLLKAKMLEAVWPQYVKTVIRFNRHHHLVNWKQFKKIEMPIPKPTPTEDADSYIDRCMSDENMNTDYPDQKQRYAICLVTYEKQAQKTILAQETFTDYPQAATTNAKRALKWREETGNPRGCGTPVGWARANQLANREPISFETIKRMAAFQRFRRFANKSYEEGCGSIVWDCWGGTEGVDYAIRKVKELEQ